MIAAVTSKLTQQQFDEDPFLRNFLRDACISWLGQRQVIVSQLNVFVKCGLVNSLEKFISFEGQAKTQPKEEKDKISSTTFSASLFQLLSDLLELVEESSSEQSLNSENATSSSSTSTTSTSQTPSQNPRDSMNPAAKSENQSNQTPTSNAPPALQSGNSNATLRFSSKNSQLEVAVLSASDALIHFGNFDEKTQKNVLRFLFLAQSLGYYTRPKVDDCLTIFLDKYPHYIDHFLKRAFLHDPDMICYFKAKNGERERVCVC